MSVSVFQAPIARVILVAGVIVLAAVFALAIATNWATNLQSGYQQIPTIGRIKLIRLPKDVTSLDDVRTFVITMNEAQDYARIFVNNYVFIDNESATKLFTNVVGSPEDLKTIAGESIDRKDYFVGARDAIYFLRKGKNFVVVEMENAHLGCNTLVDISVNGTELEHFPEKMPENLYLDSETTAELLKQQFERLKLPAVSNAVCARRIYEIDLK